MKTPKIILKKETLLKIYGDFTWMFDYRFFVETREFGNFIWNDPEYGGDNTFTIYDGSYKDFLLEFYGNPKTVGRDKGIQLIRSYCGDGFTLVDGRIKP